MGLGSLFGKKKKEEKFSGDMTLMDLKKGYFVDYFLKSWHVKGVGEYDWGNNFFSKEYTLSDGTETIYVSIQDDDELEIGVSRKIPIFKLDKEIKNYIIETDEPMGEIEYEGVTYYKSEESLGHFKEEEDSEWSELVNWDFVDENEKNFISIVRWGEQDIESYIGSNVEEYEFSNIIPAEPEKK